MSISRRFGSILPVAISVVAAQAYVSPAQAQSSGVLIGKITDRSSGAPLANVQVVVTSNALQGEQTVESDASGSYRIPNLPAGSYTIQFFTGGYKPFTNPAPVVLRTGQTIRFNAPLQKEGTQEISIVVEAPQVDVASSSSGSNLDEDFIRKVPVVSAASAPTKSFEAVAVATPGAQTDTYGTSIAGTTSPENGYKVDGVSVGNPAFGTNGSGISTEFLSEVQVVTGGYMPEYGRATGGVLSATTRSGSNEFHGTVWLSASPGALEGKRERVIRAANSIQTQKKMNYIGDLGFVVDGPIIKDKLWFAVGAQIARQQYRITREVHARSFDGEGEVVTNSTTGLPERNLVPGSAQQFQTRATQSQFFGKLTYGINQDHRLSLTAMYLPRSNGSKSFLRETGAAVVPALVGNIDTLTSVSKNTATDVSLQWLGSADNKRWTFETSLALHHETSDGRPRDGSRLGDASGRIINPYFILGNNYDHNLQGLESQIDGATECTPVQDPKNPEDPTALLYPCEARRYRAGGMAGIVSEKSMSRVQFRHTTGRTFVAAGHHNVKAGIDIEHLMYEHRRGYTGKRIIFQHRSGKDYVMRTLRGFGVLSAPGQPNMVRYVQNKTSLDAIGAFVQDSWSILDKVTLNAGVRYDAIFMFGSDGKIALSLPTQFAPRVGLIWDPTQKGKSKIFAQYAKYYQGMSLNMADRSGGSVNPGVRSFQNVDTCTKVLTDPTPANIQACDQSRDAGGRTFGSTGANQNFASVASAKTPIDPALKAQSSSEVSLGGEYNVLPNGKISLTYQRRWLDNIIEDMSRDDGHTYFIANPGSGIASDFPKAERLFDAVQLSFTKTYKDHWLAQVSYQWAKNRGNIDGLFRPESGQLDPNINSDFDLVSLLPNRKGYLASDRRHEIKAFAAGDYPVSDRIAITGGMAMNGRSGGPTSFMGRHDIYGDGEAFLLQRGTGERKPWQFEINMNLGVDLAVGSAGKLSGNIEIFNIGNFQAATGIDQNYSRDARVKLIDQKDGTIAKSKADLDAQVAQLAKDIAADENKNNGVAPGDPKATTEADILKNLKDPNFGNATAYQVPRSFRFSLRYEF